MLDKGGLAAAGMPHYAQKLPVLDGETDAVERLFLKGSAFAVSKAQIFDNDRHIASSNSSSPVIPQGISAP